MITMIMVGNQFFQSAIAFAISDHGQKKPQSSPKTMIMIMVQTAIKEGCYK